MKKLYFIIPAVFAAVFFFFYLSEKNAIQAELDKKHQEEVKAAQLRKEKEEELKAKARAEAVVQAEKRAQEREAKDRIDAEQKETLQAAKDSLANALQERERAYKQVLKLQDDTRTASDQLRRAREQNKLQQVQVEYIKNSVKDVTARKTIYEQAYNKLEIADRVAAAAEAARAAAAAPKR